MMCRGALQGALTETLRRRVALTSLRSYMPYTVSTINERRAQYST